MENDQWGKRIRAFRKLKGFTQQGFAKKLGWSVTMIGAIERGTKSTTRQQREKIALTLGVSYDEMKPREQTQQAEKPDRPAQ